MGFFRKSKNIKVGAVSPRIRLCDVAYNVEACIREAKRAAELLKGNRRIGPPQLLISRVLQV